MLYFLYLRNQFHVSPSPALSSDSRPSYFLHHHLHGGRPCSPKQQDLCGILSTSRLDPGDNPAVSGRSDGSANVAPGPGSWQPLYSLPHRARGPPRDWPPGTLLSHQLVIEKQSRTRWHFRTSVWTSLMSLGSPLISRIFPHTSRV